jgi:hypothetical protein
LLVRPDLGHILESLIISNKLSIQVEHIAIDGLLDSIEGLELRTKVLLLFYAVLLQSTRKIKQGTELVNLND